METLKSVRPLAAQNVIFHDLADSVIKDGENDLLIELEDGVGNKQTYNTKIYY